MSHPRGPRARAGSTSRTWLALFALLFVALLGRSARAGTLTVTPATVNVAPQGTQTFTASGGSAPYNWSLSVNNSGGSITAAGLYTAGATANVTDTVQATDTPVAVGDATAPAPSVGTATVNVGLGVNILPAAVTLATGAMQTFTASGGTPPYTWALTTNGSGSPGITAAGVYTAGAMAGMDVVKATDSVGNSATATITVSAADASVKSGAGTSCMTSATCTAGLTCVDSVCCTSACTNQCQACNTAGMVGTCVTIKGAPVGTRTACPGGSDPAHPCASLACDGTNPTTCTVFVGPETTCGIASCIDGLGTPGAVCTGDGGCTPVAPASCGEYACVSNACAKSCTDTAECSTGNYCNVATGKCIKGAPVPDSGAGGPGGAGEASSSSGCAMGRTPGDVSLFLMLPAIFGTWALSRRRRKG